MFTKPFFVFWIVIFILFSCRNTSISQDYLFDIKHITPSDGLADIITTAITKDRNGFMWIGTKNGLNRYDGYHFKLYTKEKHGLAQNFAITKIQEDEAGLLWLFYKQKAKFKAKDTPLMINALDIFNPKTEAVIPFDSYFKNKVPFKQKDIHYSKITDPKNRLWITTKGRNLYLYENGKFHLKYEHTPFNFHIVKIDAADNIWLVGQTQILKIDWNGNVLDEMEWANPINDIWWNVSNELQVNSRAYESEKYDFQHQFSTIKNQSKDFFYFRKNNKKLTLNARAFQYTIYRDAKQNFYIETLEGIQIFNPKGEWINNLSDYLLKSTQIDIIGSFKDQDFIWLATTVGVVKINIRANPFKLIQQKKGLSDCRGITEDNQGNIYFLNQALFKWQPQSQQLSTLSTSRTNTYATVLAKNKIWSLGGLRIVSSDLDLKQYEEYHRQPHFNKKAICILQYFNTDNYLIGGVSGLGFFDVNKKEIIPFDDYNDFEKLQKIEIKYLHQKGQYILIATTNGIFLLQKGKGIVHHFSKANGNLPNDNILHIYEPARPIGEDKEDVFWLASQGTGLIRWEVDLENKTTDFKAFTTQNGLSNDYLYAVYEDDFNNLWMSSDKGLMQMNKTTYNIKTFLTQDGLPHNEFNFTSHHQAKDGTLYFGGLGGLIAFHPKAFQQTETYHVPLVLSKAMLLENDEETMTNKTELLNTKQKIVIRPSDKFLELDFVLLDFDEADKHLYAYKIEGYSNKWYYLDGNTLRITHLPYGNYTLRIKAKNIRKDWSAQELAFELNIVKPFYLHWWFFALVTLFVAVSIYFYIKWREIKLVKTQERLEEEVRKRTLTIQKQAEALKTLDKAKTRFFSNVTHEFRTPLTLIIGPLEQILKDKRKMTHRSRLLNILKNARQLLILINQMLDLSKLEGQKMSVEITHGDIVEYTRELAKQFRPLAEKKEQILTFSTNCTEWTTNFDKNKWYKIVYNLVSNAIKYTPNGGIIEVQFNEVLLDNQRTIQFRVKDNGIGINPKNLDNIFDRFYQIDNTSTRTQGGTGIGLSLVKELVELQGGTISAESETDKGTTFTVLLPILKKMENVPFKEEKVEEIFPLVTAEVTSYQLPSNPPIIQSSNRLKLLLIEDNDEMRTYISNCLDKSKYDIIEAKDGAEGIEKAKEICPDLIISDIMMPKKNGYDVVREIRSSLVTSHIPIVLLTAKASLESRLEGFKRGTDAYLTKPFSPQELVLRIKKLIEIRQLLQNRYTANELPVPSEEFEQEDEFVLTLKAFIQDNLNNPSLNSDTIAKHFGISRTGLYNKLKALTGQSIGEHIRNIRLKTAYKLMQKGEFNLSEIAYKTGFSSLSHFSRTFKKVYGQSPSGVAKKSEIAR